MKNVLALFILIFSHLITFSQDKSVNKLKDSQDTRKKYINTDTQAAPPKDEIPKSIISTTYVNTFIGTGGHGHTYPGASAPFGMIQLSPDTRAFGWDGCGGYHYSDSVIYGFSHTHLSGVGVPDYCDLLISPQLGKAKVEPAYKVAGGYGSRFDHSSEKTAPGYYEVFLKDPKVLVRLATTERCGIHEYNFKEKKGKRYIVIDLDHRDQLISSDIKLESKTAISGHRVSKDWAKEQHFYFAMELNVPYQKSKILSKNGQHKLVLEFSEKIQQIKIKVGISAVDVDGAKENLGYEIMDFDLSNVFTTTIESWAHELNKVEFNSTNKDELVTFYTALYHSFLSPNLFNDVDGRYRGRDNQIHKLATTFENQYTVFSLWDTYRATHPLFTLLQKQRTGEMINTFLRQYDQAGELPVWELAGNETDCMIGYHAASVITDAYMKKIQNFDIEKGYQAMLKSSKINELGKIQFSKNGFISYNEEPESVSKSLEYAYDDYCISIYADAIQNKQKKNEDVRKEYLNRSMNFINLYDPSTKFMRARKSGLWYSPFDPSEVNMNYTEANSYQYSLYTPHAIGVLINLLGGKDELEKWLDQLFSAESKLNGRDQVDISGLIGQYAHGNEPSHHMAYLYNYTNHPHKTQFYIDKILNEMYSTKPDGLAGNEDCGQMSSWYVLSAMGIYQIAPGNPYFEIGRPLGEKTTLKLENRKEFTIKVTNQSKDNKYIQKLKLNGRKINRLYLSYDDIYDGGTIEFEMGPEPNSKVDQFEHAPTIETVPSDFIPVPYFEQTAKNFNDSMTVCMNYPNIKDRGFQIKYTIDGSEPTINSKTFKSPFTITETKNIKCLLVDTISKTVGKSVMNEFVKIDNSIHLNLLNNYANQYAASGQNTLIDGVSGGNDYRTGDWQGFQGTDIIAEVSFDTTRSLKEIGLSCIEDTKSWIFYPQSILIETSTDGINYTKSYSIQGDNTTNPESKSKKEYTVQTSNKEGIKKIRIKAISIGKCPDWHLGKGNDSWLFSDEIIMR